MTFVKQVLSDARKVTNLERNRSLEMLASNGVRFTGIVDFIAHASGAHHVFLMSDAGTRMVLKVYSNRTLVELVVYKEATVNVYKISSATVTHLQSQEELKFDNSEVLYYFGKEKAYKWVPVVVGDEFGKAGKLFTVLAITKNGGTMFMEDDKGNGVSVNLNDKTLIDAFSGFKWGQADK